MSLLIFHHHDITIEENKRMKICANKGFSKDFPPHTMTTMGGTKPPKSFQGNNLLFTKNLVPNEQALTD